MARPTNAGRGATLFHPGFIGAGSGLLAGAFATDVLYARNALWQWSNLSAWLIVFGLIAALVAAIFLVIDLATGRAGPIRWSQFVLVAAAALLSIANALVHSRDAWTSVVPEGIALSAIVTVLLLIVALRGWRVTAPRLGEGDRP